MKQFTLLLLLLCATNFHLSAQPVVSYDPCGELRVALFNADKLISQGKLDEALEKLNKFKNDPEMRNCPEMKEGMVDFKINDVKKRIAERDGLLISYKQCPDGNHPHLIDLGLPSGTKWACCNVDAKKPEDYGGYYAWGETSERSGEHSWKTYKYCNGDAYSCHNLGSSICGTQYDVAHVKWGGSWQMPTNDQIEELLDKCNKGVWTTQNGVKGRKFTGPNGASIFLPAAGGRWGAGLDARGSSGDYWSGAQDASHESYACRLFFYSVDASTNSGNRDYGRSVRPVSR